MNNIQAQFEGFLKTPDIFPDNSQAPFPLFEFPDLEATTCTLSDLEQLQHPRNSVLGKRMESFFEIAIKHSERYKIVASNLQIIEKKRTLGEIDFLLFDKIKSRPVHVELVYKLYIYEPELPAEMDRWIGPNRKDSLSAKLEKLRSGQFPLLYRPETLEYLKGLDLKPEEVEQQLCFKAKLFTPEGFEISGNLPVNTESFTGNWFRYPEFLKQPWQNNLFMSPAKKDWSAQASSGSEWLPHSQIINKINILFERKKSPLIWMKTPEAYKSFFVVSW